MEINLGEILAKVLMKNKEFKKKPRTRGHLACKRDQVTRPSWVIGEQSENISSFLSGNLQNKLLVLCPQIHRVVVKHKVWI
jgi:hypothetical protein